MRCLFLPKLVGGPNQIHYNREMVRSHTVIFLLRVKSICCLLSSCSYFLHTLLGRWLSYGGQYSGWQCFTNASNKEEQKAVVDAYFVQPLVRKNGQFWKILATKFRDLIINWKLAPKNFDGSKPHVGLGPLSFVTRTLAEQENLGLTRGKSYHR
jgi:hypothetical protein